VGSKAQLFVHTHYKADGAALYGFLTRPEKDLFLMLIKVDSVGPKSALNILSAAEWAEIVRLIEDGDTLALSKLPKISKKTAEHLVVKLKGKLTELLLLAESGGAEAPAASGTSVAATGGRGAVPGAKVPMRVQRKIRGEASTALVHLGYRGPDVDRVLDQLDEEVWSQDLPEVIRQALGGLSQNL
jgi:Holliday junction DNA helicase RuvA